jgi:hypothetical protein
VTMNFYPPATHAYNAGYDDGFFDHYKREYRTKAETAAYERGYHDGVKHRPKPKVTKAKKPIDKNFNHQ